MPEITALIAQAETLFQTLDTLPLTQRVMAINLIRRCLHEHSPFADQPVDFVQWVNCEDVQANDYNPNTVAPPEMRLLELSIREDGFTQPIVAFKGDGQHWVVVDGFHRQRVGKKNSPIKRRLHGYLPIVPLRAGRTETDRIAATIRHNRARGVHGVLPMTEVVVKLLLAGWSDEDVAHELGMDRDEVMRFKQVSGLPELFCQEPYSRSWD